MATEFKSFFSTPSGNEGEKCHYPTRLDTYGCGCQHNCSYCYARSLLDFRRMWNAARPSVADLEDIKRLIREKLKAGDIVRLGGMTDCFQPMEREYRVTLQTIRALNRAGVGYLIVTKNALVAENEYLATIRKDLAHIQVTITSTDEKVSRMIEPGASLPEERIRAVERLSAEGFDTAVRLSPYIEQFCDVEKINRIKCDKIVVEFLRVNGWIKRWLPMVDFSEYKLHQSGYSHLPLWKKRQMLRKVSGFRELTVCEDVSEHYAYWQQAVNTNIDDCCNGYEDSKEEIAAGGDRAEQRADRGVAGQPEAMDVE